MENKYIYIGLFFEEKELFDVIKNIRQVSYSIEPTHPHVTLDYSPTYVDESLFGTRVRLRLMGYGFDNANEGFSTEIVYAPQVIRDMSDSVYNPHVSTSRIEKGKFANTVNLSFEPLTQPIEIDAVFGRVLLDTNILITK